MGRPLYPMYDDVDYSSSERRREEDAVLLARERVVRWVAGDFDPDSDDFFSSAVEEFGIPSSCKEVPSARSGGVHEAASPISTPQQWTAEVANLPSWQLVDVEADHSERPLPTSLSYPDLQLSSRVRAHFLQNAPLPSSQSLRTPEIHPRDLTASPGPYESVGAGASPQSFLHDAPINVGA